MGKDLSEMTLEELWDLFPIFLVAHDDGWKDSFNEIGKTLTGMLIQPQRQISYPNGRQKHERNMVTDTESANR